MGGLHFGVVRGGRNSRLPPSTRSSKDAKIKRIKRPTRRPAARDGSLGPQESAGIELVWAGKYDDDGQRRRPDLAGEAMTLRETARFAPLSEDVAARTSGSLSNGSANGADRQPPNMLVWADNLLAMGSLLRTYRGKVQLVYLDPPFTVGADFSARVPLGDGRVVKRRRGATATRDDVLSIRAFRDAWHGDGESYLNMMYDRLTLVRELLDETGTVYVHCDWRANSVLRLVLDEIFGRERFLNEIVWHYNQGGKSGRRFARKHDTILVFAKGKRPKFNSEAVRVPYTPHKQDRHGRNYGGQMGTDEEGRAYVEKWGTGRKKRYRYYLDEGKLAEDVWSDIQSIQAGAKERCAYPTQKPEALLERIIRASSDEGDLVADFFCGSGTTGAVCEQLGRRWILCDVGRLAVRTSEKRLMARQGQLVRHGQSAREFGLFEFGARERRSWWRQQCSASNEEEEYVRKVLDGFGAEWLDAPEAGRLALPGAHQFHGRRGSQFCYVHAIDQTLARDDVSAVVQAALEHGAGSVACLAWDFDIGLRRECEVLEHDLGVRIALMRIPRELMDDESCAAALFRDLPHVEIEPVYYRETAAGATQVDVRLMEFHSTHNNGTAEGEGAQDSPANQSAADESVDRAVNGFERLESWAVDFDYQPGQPFCHDWHATRTRDDRTLETMSTRRYVYPGSGRYVVAVRLIDVFGDETVERAVIEYPG